jgi:hypothetical protein
MQKSFFRYLCLIVVFIPIMGNSQILVPFADYSSKTAYSDSDSVYVFNVGNESAYIIADTQNYSAYRIEWEEYIPGSGFQSIAWTNPRIDISSSDTLSGYRLRLISADDSDTIGSVCWAMWNDFAMEIISKDADGNITRDALTSSDCVWIGYIQVKLTQDSIRYYNPNTNKTISFVLPYTSSFSADPLPDAGYGVMKKASTLNGLLRYSIDNSWWEDAIYTISITDEANLVREDDINVTAIRPHADFDFEYVPLDDKEFYPDRDPLYYSAYDGGYYDYSSAPGIYMFTPGESISGDSLIWHFGDSTTATTIDTNIAHQYYSYGAYKVWLEAINYFDFRRSCTDVSESDSAKFDTPDFVTNEGSIQNVFTPPNGLNPIWRYEDVSITFFEIAIYNRYGRRVHHFEGNIRDWLGWDGTVNNTSNYVSTGVYYYVLKDYNTAPKFGAAQNPEIDNSVKKGMIHVFNTE